MSPRPISSRTSREIAAFVGDLEGALAGLAARDADGCADLAWLARCPLLEGLRSDPRSAPIRARFEARAHAVVNAYLGPGGA